MKDFGALKLGDRTALNAKRLNLNPLNHLDIFGSVILPLILAISGGPTRMDPRGLSLADLRKGRFCLQV
jgi:Zn-dependent protease